LLARLCPLQEFTALCTPNPLVRFYGRVGVGKAGMATERREREVHRVGEKKGYGRRLLTH